MGQNPYFFGSPVLRAEKDDTVSMTLPMEMQAFWQITCSFNAAY